jgi:hypothetical protein
MLGRNAARPGHVIVADLPQIVELAGSAITVCVAEPFPVDVEAGAPAIERGGALFGRLG